MQGLKDQLIIDHKARGLELLVFYRKSKTEYPGAGFRYEGRFEYVLHTGAHPTSFRLERIDPILETAQHDLEALLAEEERYLEGNRTQVLVNRYERDAIARAAAIRAHGTNCQVCGFSFLDCYGSHGKGFIEVHHLRPLSSYQEEVLVDPVKDMAVICANCYRMIHRRPEEPLTLEQLKFLIEHPNTTSQAEQC